MEAVQFHPTGIFPAGILVTEGCRGDGGLLKDVDGHRFMPDYEPEKKELASRDVVSRRMEQHIANGKGAKSRFGEHLWLDITLLGEKHIQTQPARGLRDLPELPRRRPGEGLHRRAAGAALHDGRRAHRPTGQSPTLKGLFAAGEAACWDMHGFNRLGGNSVAETVVAGMIVGEAIADFCDRSDNDVNVPDGPGARVRCEREQAQLDALHRRRRQRGRLGAAQARMQEIMTAKVGIFRHGADLRGGRRRTAAAAASAAAASACAAATPGANPELVTAYRVQKMLKLALCVAYGALQRTESRGAHFREDYPAPRRRRSGSSARWPPGRATATRCRRWATSRWT